MRRIKFRGKTLKEQGMLPAGSWIEGGYYVDYCYGGCPEGKHYIVTWNSMGPGGFTDLVQVDPETVGQYTGLKDKNGKEIYEGDILRFPPKDWREERDFIGYEVFYHDNDCADNHVGFQMNRMRFYGNLCGGECKAKMLPKYTLQMEVICNIHEQKAGEN